MAKSTEDVSRSTCGRPVLVPTHIENLNATARAHGLVVSASRIVREEALVGYQRHSTTNDVEHLVTDWRGTGAQLRSLGWILPSWSFPVATTRGPGCKRLETKWGVGGYAHVPVNAEEVIFEIDHGEVPLGISASDGVETVSFGWCAEHHGTKATLIAAGIADAQRLGGTRPRKTNGGYPDEPRWWRLLQPDGTIVFGIETDLSWRRRKKEKEHREQARESQASESRQSRIEGPQFDSAGEWKKHLERQLDSITGAYKIPLLGQPPGRFELHPDSEAHILGILERSRRELAEAFAAAKVLDSQRAKLRLVVDNSP
jgi:hypothetical protein